jgi:hypothetical protein
MRALRYAALAGTVVLGATAACGGDGVTVVTVRTRPAVRGVEELAVTMANANATLTESFAVDGRTFPLTFSIETGGRDGVMELRGDGLDRDGKAVGSGLATVDLGGRSDIDLMIEPNDFTVNTSFVGDQALAFRLDAGGRQLAVGPDGVFTINRRVNESQTSSVALRRWVRCRLDGGGTPDAAGAGRYRGIRRAGSARPGAALGMGGSGLYGESRCAALQPRQAEAPRR